ncbi:MAG: deoxyhypusine synthase family protein, partial [archaeon]
KKSSGSIDIASLDKIKGFDPTLLGGYASRFKRLGFQASELGRACELVDEIKKEKCAIFLTCTSNMVSSGLREIIAQLCEKKLITAIVTTTGAIEEDVIKTMSPFLLGDFEADDAEVKANSMNRLGNIYVPDKHYCDFEDWHNAFIKEIYSEKKLIPASEYIFRMGKKLTDKHSVLCQASKNGIPIFCPGFVDGAMGDHLFFFNQNKKEPLIVDTTTDLNRFYQLVLGPDKIAGVVLGGGISKHHLIGAAILRDGLDYAIYLSTGTQYDGSLSGAHPKEAVSWNKLKNKKNSVLVEADATLTFPFVAAALLG